MRYWCDTGFKRSDGRKTSPSGVSTQSYPCLTKASLSNWLALGIELSNLNGNFEGPSPVTGGNACLLEDSYSIQKSEL